MLLIEARIGEISTADKMTKQMFYEDSPFTNIVSINSQVVTATSQYLLTRNLILEAEHTALSNIVERSGDDTHA